jgi:hypothetical protein
MRGQRIEEGSSDLVFQLVKKNRVTLYLQVRGYLLMTSHSMRVVVGAIHRVRCLKGSLWTDIKVIPITERFN